MIKKAISILMTILLLLITSQQAALIVLFKLNQQAIEQQFCINKDKPELQCHGKCHLKKELEKSVTTDLELNDIGKKIEIALISNYEFPFYIQKIITIYKVLIYKECEWLEPCLEIFVPPPILGLNIPSQ